MRFMSMVKANEAKASVTSKAMFDAINELVQEASKDGCVMVQSGGLLPTSSGMRVRLADGKLTVTDDPFAEAKEVVGGYFLFRAANYEEAVELIRDCPFLQDGRLALRQTDPAGCGGE